MVIIAMNDTINDDSMFLRKFCAIRLLTLSQTLHFQKTNLKPHQLNFENAVIIIAGWIIAGWIIAIIAMNDYRDERFFYDDRPIPLFPTVSG